MPDPTELIGHRVVASRREEIVSSVPVGTTVSLHLPPPIRGILVGVNGEIATMTTSDGPVALVGSEWRFYPERTPYDTGERGEPTIWSVTEDNDEDYGKVDFDDDASEVIATVWFERRDDGRYELVVNPARDISIRMESQ